MPITVQCACGHSLEVSSFLVGKSCKCPECNGWIAVSAAPLPVPPPVPPPPRGITIPAEPRPSGTRVVPSAPAPATPLVPPAPRRDTSVAVPVSRLPLPLENVPAAPPSVPAAPAPRPPNNPFAVPSKPAPRIPAAPPPIPSVVRGRTGIVPPAEKPNLFGSAREKPKPGASVIGELRYWLLALALIPLVMALFRPDDNIRERIEATSKKYPSHHQQKKLKQPADEEQEEEEDEENYSALHRLIARTPDKRIDGAHLALGSHMHWLYALASAGFFFGVVLLIFPLGNAKATHLLLSGLFTGTIGIFLLLTVQYLAFTSFGFLIGGGVLTIITLALKAIAWCYYVALSPSSGFVASLIGYIFGIGLCEEVCKGLVIFYLFSAGKKLDWRGACVWGLASGVGFGVSEGISYAGGMYNGIMPSDIYLIRFISCVALHGIWSAAVGLSAYRNRAELRATRWTVLKICIVPMILHGAYDTLLKEQFPGGAVLCALCSFAWLAYQFECTYAEAGGSESEVETEPAAA